MFNQILKDLQGILKGPNGTLFMVILVVFGGLFFLKILPMLLQFGIPVLVMFFVFRFYMKYRDKN